MPIGVVHVLGSLNVDHPVRVNRHPAIGQTVRGTVLAATPGGKGLNQAVAAARAGRTAGVEVVLYGRVGDDDAGRWLVDLARSERVEVDGIVIDTALPTGSAQLVVADDGANTVIVDPGANAATTWTGATRDLTVSDVAVAQLEVPPSAVEGFLAVASRVGMLSILNPSPAEGAERLVSAADVLVVNEHELSEMAGRPDVRSIDDLAAIEAATARLGRCAAQTVVVTFGASGLVTIGPEGADVVAGESARAVDTTGAGDCFLGVLAASLAGGASMAMAVRRANRGAALSVERPGTVPAMPSAAELDR